MTADGVPATVEQLLAAARARLRQLEPRAAAAARSAIGSRVAR